MRACAVSDRNSEHDKQKKTQSNASGNEQCDNVFDQELTKKKKAQDGDKIHNTEFTKGKRDVASMLHMKKARAKTFFACIKSIANCQHGFSVGLEYARLTGEAWLIQQCRQLNTRN